MSTNSWSWKRYFSFRSVQKSFKCHVKPEKALFICKKVKLCDVLCSFGDSYYFLRIFLCCYFYLSFPLEWRRKLGNNIRLNVSSSWPVIDCTVKLKIIWISCMEMESLLTEAYVSVTNHKHSNTHMWKFKKYFGIFYYLNVLQTF